MIHDRRMDRAIDRTRADVPLTPIEVGLTAAIVAVEAEEHVHELIDFVQRWDRRAPIAMHCYAGISRSTAGAFISACALNPDRDEAIIAQTIRDSSKTAAPNIMLVSHADRILGRNGRMIAAVEALGPGLPSLEGHPFRLDLE